MSYKRSSSRVNWCHGVLQNRQSRPNGHGRAERHARLALSRSHDAPEHSSRANTGASGRRKFRAGRPISSTVK